MGVSEDTGGSWSELLSDEVSPYAGCSSGSPVAPPVSPPVTSPVAPPTSPPVTSPIAPPTSSPVSPPIETGSYPSGFTGLYPTSGCTSFHHCDDGTVVSAPTACPSGLLFDVEKQYCDWANNVNCPL